MRKFGISVRHSVETEALDLVKYQKFEAAVVDFNVPLASMILDQLHGSASNKTAVTFAILNGKSGRASSLKGFLVKGQGQFCAAQATQSELDVSHTTSRLRNDSA